MLPSPLLQACEEFTRLDISQAYLQLVLSETVIINTQKGLFWYNRLIFGIASAPGIFQRVMESLLSGIPRILAYLDDILTKDADHLEPLQET